MQNLFRVHRSYKHHCQWVSFKLDGMLEFHLVKMMGTVAFTEHVLGFSNLSKLQSLVWYLRDADWLYRKWWLLAIESRYLIYVQGSFNFAIPSKSYSTFISHFFFIPKEEQTIYIVGCGDNSTSLEVHHGECGLSGTIFFNILHEKC